MTIPQCVLLARTDHCSQVYAGFSMLAEAGVIWLRQRLAKPHCPPLEVIVNDSTKICYDVFDGGQIPYRAALESCDYYFKRSFLQSEVPAAYRDKVFPLGLFYPVFPDQVDRYQLQRCLFLGGGTGARLKMLLRLVLDGVGLGSLLPGFTPTTSRLHQLPRPTKRPRVIFMARAWDPDAPEVSGKPELQEERHRINVARVRFIELLRKEFGDRFTGGLAHDDFTVRKFKQVLVPDARMASRSNYLTALREHSIGIATVGLHGSIGGKLGEYVAFSKAVVSEPLPFELPGQFSKNVHYLEFQAEDDLVNQVARLSEEEDTRNCMAQANLEYYLGFLRPDQLVKNTLIKAKVLP